MRFVTEVLPFDFFKTFNYVIRKMSGLTAEQLKQIAKNRELALLKKRKNAENSGTDKPCNSSSLQKVFSGCDRDQKNLPIPQAKDLSAPVQTANVSATMRLISESQFTVDMPFHMPSIELFRTIPGKIYDPNTKRWIFPLSSYYILQEKLQKLATVSSIPKVIINALLESENENDIDLSKIDKVLLDSLLPFQREGIRFGVSKRGRCLIADDMGLGKTIQALGIAHYYHENWPLLILCPSSMRFPWEEAIQVFLPSVNPFYVTVMTSGKDLINEAKVDESHCLKSLKTTRTKASLQVAKKCKNVILLSGTPALSRPMELYSQIIAINPGPFLNCHEFGMRYCDGKIDNYGWNFNGSSNTEELEFYLKKKIMIRRLKSEVITQLPSKIRKVIMLNPDTVTKQMKALAHTLNAQKGDMKKTLLLYYSLTASAKAKAVCDYVEQKLESNPKMLVFAHHTVVMNALCEMIKKKNIDFIKIDGATSSETRKNLCDRFQSREDCRVAVLSLRAANSGITLTAAQLVIFAELYWNPGDLTQAEDRAHRIGQQGSVIVEYLVAKGTADEHIWNLVQSKLKFLNKVGLSKDCFKEVDVKQFKNGKQLTLTSMFQSESTENNSTKSNAGNCDAFECWDEMDNYDELFENIVLEDIENQNNVEPKKMKTDMEH